MPQVCVDSLVSHDGRGKEGRRKGGGRERAAESKGGKRKEVEGKNVMIGRRWGCNEK